MADDPSVLVQYGAVGFMAITFIGLYLGSIKKGDAREERIAAEAKQREADMRKECKEREEALAARLQKSEDERAQDSRVLMATFAETNRINAKSNELFARAFDRWVEKEDVGSGRHPSR